ncbi:MAG: CoA pyrophosphatase [Actinomycetota bacterium]
MIDDWRELQALLDQRYEPNEAETAPRAAVAAVFRQREGDGMADGPGGGSELLFIQRATKPTDPWSGQMAFPGGREELADSSPRHTAARETAEEVGLDLSPARFLGTLSELDGGRANNRRIIVSAHAWWLPGPRPTLDLNHEVADVVWVPLRELANDARYIDYRYPLTGTTFPGIQLDHPDQVIWGLTLRLLADLFSRIDHPFVAL